MSTEFKVGDRVRATLGANVLVGSVSEVSGGDRLRIVCDNKQAFWVAWSDGWHFEKVSPPLPTKVGAIVRRYDGELFVYDGATRDPWMKLDGSGGGVGPAFVSEGGFEVIFEGVDQ